MSMSLRIYVGAAGLLFLAQGADAGSLELGRAALPEEIKAWDIDVRPDGKGLPAGQGSVKEGETQYQQQCASCHGEFGEGVGRWPALAGGNGSLKSERPLRTAGSFWPYAATLYDYTYRTMPFGNPQSLTPDQTYAIVAYLLNLNNLVKEDFVLSAKTFGTIRLENEPAFFDDNREEAEKTFWQKDPCMKNCKADVKILSRAGALEVTPEGGNGAAKGE